MNDKTPKVKPLMPSLREKKRYMLYQVVSDKKFSQVEIETTIKKAQNDFLGILGSAKAGVMILKNKFDEKEQTGIIRVSAKYMDHMKTALGLVQKIKDHDAVIRTIKVSGVLKKTTVN